MCWSMRNSKLIIELSKYTYLYFPGLRAYLQKSIRLRYIKLHIDTFVMIIRTLS